MANSIREMGFKANVKFGNTRIAHAKFPSFIFCTNIDNDARIGGGNRIQIDFQMRGKRGMAMEFEAICRRLGDEISKAYIGKREDIDALIIAMLTGGHVLIEGVPGLAKTTLARALSQVVDAQMTRVQFTADLMPSDITGSSLFNAETGQFQFIEGPVFTNIFLADEINRAPARTQSALLEAMQESQVTVDGCTHELGTPFFVIATQNACDERGTYALPMSQLDRFLFRIRLTYPTAADEERILMQAAQPPKIIESVITPADFLKMREAIDSIYVSPAIVRYIAKIVRATRVHRQIAQGASPRSGVMILRAARGHAFIENRDYVSPSDVQAIIRYALNHRIVPVSGATSVDDSLEEILYFVKFE